MRFDPVVCLLVQICLYKGIVAVSKDSYKYPCLCELISVWSDKLCWITDSNFYLLTRFPRDVHNCSVFFFILLDIIAKPEIHKRFFAVYLAFTTVFYP